MSIEEAVSEAVDVTSSLQRAGRLSALAHALAAIDANAIPLEVGVAYVATTRAPLPEREGLLARLEPRLRAERPDEADTILRMLSRPR